MSQEDLNQQMRNWRESCRLRRLIREIVAPDPHDPPSESKIRIKGESLSAYVERMLPTKEKV